MSNQQAEQNFAAMIAAGYVLGRILIPVGRHGFRMAWHAFDRATGGWQKVEGVDELDIPEALANTLPQQQPQQQQTTTNRKIKAEVHGKIIIYSKTPAETTDSENSEPVPDLLPKFEDVGGAFGSCQFGPRPRDNYDHTTYTTANNAVDDQEAICKRNSIGDGKHGTIGQTDTFHTYDWGNDKVKHANDKISEARFKRLEDMILKIHERLPQPQQTEIQPTATVTEISIPVQNPVAMKTLLHNINIGTTNNNTVIVNGNIRRPNRSPASDDSPGDRNNGGDSNRVENGNGGGDDGDDDPTGITINTMARAGGRFEDRSWEFSLVKSSNIIIQTFSGKNLHHSRNGCT